METLEAGKKTRDSISDFNCPFCSAAKLPCILGFTASLKTPEEIAGSAPYALQAVLPQKLYQSVYRSQSYALLYEQVWLWLCVLLLGIVVLSAPSVSAISKIQFKQNEKEKPFSCSA